MTSLSAFHKKIKQNSSLKTLQSCILSKQLPLEHIQESVNQINFPIFISDYDSSSLNSKQIIIDSDSKTNYIQDLQSTQECQCRCHKHKQLQKQMHKLINHKNLQILELLEFIRDLKDSNDELKTQIEIEIENQKQIMQIFCNKITSFIKEKLPKVIEEAQLKYQNILSEVQKYNSKLKKKLILVEKQVSQYREQIYALKYNKNKYPVSFKKPCQKNLLQNTCQKCDSQNLSFMSLSNSEEQRINTSRVSTYSGKSFNMDNIHNKLMDIKAEISDYYTKKY